MNEEKEIQGVTIVFLSRSLKKIMVRNHWICLLLYKIINENNKPGRTII
jgi:hypothetical protein